MYYNPYISFRTVVKALYDVKEGFTYSLNQITGAPVYKKTTLKVVSLSWWYF